MDINAQEVYLKENIQKLNNLLVEQSTGIATKKQLTEEYTQLTQEANKEADWVKNRCAFFETFIKNVENNIYEESVGKYNVQLSAFVKSVMGEEGQAREIKLSPSRSAKGNPTLDIYAINNGNEEDIYDANGGSITNIVASGVRLLALAKNNTQRRFVVLDEPDCWISPDKIQNFANVIGELAKNLGIQVIIISHHDSRFFAKYGRVIRLERSGDVIDTEITHDEPCTPEQSNADYISSITLKDFMSHIDTTLHFHPVLTCIVGDNNIGKSAIANAIRVIVEGDNLKNASIHHGRHTCSVSLSTSRGNTVVWRRSAKGGRVSSYRLYDKDNNLLNEAYETTTPQFVQDVLNINSEYISSLHIPHQKAPAEILANNATAKELRGSLLSFGKVGEQIKAMLDKLKQKKTEKNANIKTLTALANDKKKKIAEFGNIEERYEDTQWALEKGKESEKKLGLLNDIQTGVTKINTLIGIDNAAVVNAGELDNTKVKISSYSRLCALVNNISLLKQTDRAYAINPLNKASIENGLFDVKHLSAVTNSIKNGYSIESLQPITLLTPKSIAEKLGIDSKQMPKGILHSNVVAMAKSAEVSLLHNKIAHVNALEASLNTPKLETLKDKVDVANKFRMLKSIEKVQSIVLENMISTHAIKSLVPLSKISVLLNKSTLIDKAMPLDANTTVPILKTVDNGLIVLLSDASNSLSKAKAIKTEIKEARLSNNQPVIEAIENILFTQNEIDTLQNKLSQDNNAILKVIEEISVIEKSMKGKKCPCCHQILQFGDEHSH